MHRILAAAIVTLHAIFALTGTAAADVARDSWMFAQDRLARSDPRLRDWTEDIARIEITASTAGTRAHPPTITFKVVEVLRAGYFPPTQSAVWLGDNVAGDAEWLARQTNGTLDAWGAQLLEAPPAGTTALVLTMFDGETTMFSADGFFPDTPANRDTALQFSATEPWSERLAHSMFFLVPLLAIAGLVVLRKHPNTALLIAAATYAAFTFYNSRIPISANIRVDLLVLNPALWVSGATAVGALALIAWRYRKRR